MTSPAKVAANIANAQHSTGPKTEEGKKVSSRNAMSHGLYSSVKLIHGETQEELDELRVQTFIDLAPANVAETTIVDDLVYLLWRLRRINLQESREFEKIDSDIRRLNLFGTMSSRTRRDIACVLRTLSAMQKDRRKHEKEQLPPAMAIRRADVAAGRTTNLGQFGFDLSLEFVDQQIHLSNALNRADRTLKLAATAKAA